MLNKNKTKIPSKAKAIDKTKTIELSVETKSNFQKTWTWAKWVLLFAFAALIIFLIISYGESTGFVFWKKWTTTATQYSKAGAGPMQIDLMQVLITFFGGGALGVAGALLQKVTKNRLAEVSILGIGSLNILFIYIYATVFKDKAFGSGTTAYIMPILLIIVSIFGTMIIWAISRSKRANKNTFVIIGIAMQLFVEALSVIVVNPQKMLASGTGTGGAQSQGKKIWAKIQGYTLGDVRSDISNPDSNPVQWWLIFLVIGIVTAVIATIFFLRKKIDTYETSEELAHATGIKIGRLRLVIYLLVSLLAGAASATLGTVALLGIIAPSIARMLFKNKMWSITIASFVIGGSMVGLASWLSLQYGWGIYIGILSTAIIIPYFIFLMIRDK